MGSGHLPMSSSTACFAIFEDRFFGFRSEVELDAAAVRVADADALTARPGRTDGFGALGALVRLGGILIQVTR